MLAGRQPIDVDPAVCRKIARLLDGDVNHDVIWVTPDADRRQEVARILADALDVTADDLP